MITNYIVYKLIHNVYMFMAGIVAGDMNRVNKLLAILNVWILSDEVTWNLYLYGSLKKAALKLISDLGNLQFVWQYTMIQKWNAQGKNFWRLYCLFELAVLVLIFYSYNSVSDLRFSLVVEQCNSKQVCCRKTIETTQFFSLSVSVLYHSARTTM